MPVVVVESPAKAKTINKYLGSDYTVLASYGHVRDLPPKDGSVDPDDNFEMLWEVASDSKKHIKAIADALKDDNELILATDPDREGEAISWHLEEALRKRKSIKKDTPVSRVVFNAITKTAVTEAMKNPTGFVAPSARRKICRPRAICYPADHRRTRNGNRSVQHPRILVCEGSASNATIPKRRGTSDGSCRQKARKIRSGK